MLPPLGFEWFVAALVGLLSLAVHTMPLGPVKVIVVHGT